ncbi:MAG: propanediol utilization protein, partial [Chthoniobacterales bacterium]
MRKLFASLLLVLVPLGIFAQPLWQDVKENSIPVSSPRQIVPLSYRTARLDQAALADLLARAPMEFTEAATKAAVVMTIPMPDGTFARFRIQESPISAPDPSGKVSEFRSYSGQGIDDPTATLRCDISPAGFHAQILSSGESVYVDPYTLNDQTNFISYYRRDARRQGAAPLCFAAELQSPVIKQLARAALSPTAPNGPSGSVLRTVRSAFAATGEYTTFFRQGMDTDDQAKARALNAIKVTLNRVNGIWEKDAAVRYVLLADATELTIIYTDPNTDPYTNNNASKLSDENQVNLDNVIGTANYDHGHVVSTSPGGEGTGGVCVTGDKAKGVTGSAMPVGDPFDVDFVAHEIIHQWGGNHTFNAGTVGECTAANRNGPTAYEPGSGSTTASYAGICGVENLQMSSDDYFHGASIQEILNWLNTTGTCAATVTTGNTPPTVTAPASFTIPKNTPFTLTATASDPDPDTLTYSWEEFDIGAASPPETDDGTRPIFRPYKPTTSPSRTFPSLTYILNNANVPPATFTGTSATGTNCGAGQTCISGEVMPSTTRTMNFRVQVRDNRAGGGGINDATTQVMVRADSGPFVITAPNTAVTVAGGSQLNVTWNVANTTAAPVSAVNVKISLSTDGGNTFPNVLAASVPNNGSANVTVPNIATTTARIKVEAVGNIFFDISDANFTITANGATPGLVANVSTRLPVGQDPNALIQGFIVQGPAGSTKKIIVRALGPFLQQFGITDFLANPTLDIFDVNQVKVAS